MSDPMPAVVAVIVNFNGGEIVLETIESLQASNYPELNIIVVDNNSHDRSAERISSEYPKVLLIRNKKNLGFAIGCNQGMEAGFEQSAEHILFINSDATVEENTISGLVEVLLSKQKAGAVTPVILYHDKRDMIWYGGGYVLIYLGAVGHLFLRKTYKQKNLRFNQTDYLTGCIFLARSSVLRDIGGFDDSFGLYSEDVDLSIRMRESGWELWIDPDIKSYHRVSASMGGELSPFKAFYRSRSMLLLFKKHAPNWWWTLPLMFGFFGGTMISLKLLFRGKIKAVFALWNGSISGIFGLEIPTKYKMKDS